MIVFVRVVVKFILITCIFAVLTISLCCGQPTILNDDNNQSPNVTYRRRNETISDDLLLVPVDGLVPIFSEYIRCPRILDSLEELNFHCYHLFESYEAFSRDILTPALVGAFKAPSPYEVPCPAQLSALQGRTMRCGLPNQTANHLQYTRRCAPRLSQLEGQVFNCHMKVNADEYDFIVPSQEKLCPPERVFWRGRCEPKPRRPTTSV